MADKKITTVDTIDTLPDNGSVFVSDGTNITQISKQNAKKTLGIDELNETLDAKVDKVDGKALSTNDYTNEDKEKLASLNNYDDTEVKQEISNVNETLDDLNNAVYYMTEYFKQTVNATFYKMINTTIPSGYYHIAVDNITSTDTVTTVSTCRFVYDDNTAITYNFTRNTPINIPFTFYKNVKSIWFYASNDASNSKNNDFEYTNFRIYQGEDKNIKDKIIELSDEIYNFDIIYKKLNGKKLGYVGDSISNGAGFAGGYGKIIADTYGMTYKNNSRNGATIGNHDGSAVIMTWVNNLCDSHNDCDYVLIEGGFNDSWVDDSVLGTIDETYATPTQDGTFCGNLNYLLWKLIHSFHDKKFFFIIVHKAGDNYTEDSEYYKATIKLCKKWGVPICDLNGTVPPFALLGSNDVLYQTYTGINGTPDGVHPNELGYNTFYVPKILNFMMSL